MSWALFLRTFVTVFVLELGDKTQLGVFTMAATSTQRWVVFGGAMAAFLASTAVGVLAGAFVGNLVDAVWIKRIAGIIFIVFGLLFLLNKI